MSSTGLEVFDKTIQTTNSWLNEIGEDLGPDRQRCYNALRAVLFALRDRLTVEEAADLSAQLPMLIRGISTRAIALDPCRKNSLAGRVPGEDRRASAKHTTPRGR